MSASGAVAAAGCLDALRGCGFDFFTGVADSLVASLIDQLTPPPPAVKRSFTPSSMARPAEGGTAGGGGVMRGGPTGYVPAVREDAAVGMASGAYLAGRWPAVLMQNSGLGYCLNALTSLNLIYRIPLLLLVGYRGYGGNDAPEHGVMGRHCERLVREVGIPVWVPKSSEDLPGAIAEADRFMRRERIPAAVFICPGVL